MFNHNLSDLQTHINSHHETKVEDHPHEAKDLQMEHQEEYRDPNSPQGKINFHDYYKGSSWTVMNTSLNPAKHENSTIFTETDDHQ